MKIQGQSAVEFLMTYGWALLLLIVVGVVAYQLGLFSIGGRVEPGSSGFWGLVPTDFKFSAASKSFDVSMSNYVGAKVTIMMDGSTCAIVGATQVCPSSGNALVNPGETALLSFPSLTPSAAAGDRFEVLLTAKYVDERTGGSHITSGRIWGAYEQ